jgi:hypothetical protein
VITPRPTTHDLVLLLIWSSPSHVLHCFVSLSPIHKMKQPRCLHPNQGLWFSGIIVSQSSSLLSQQPIINNVLAPLATDTHISGSGPGFDSPRVQSLHAQFESVVYPNIFCSLIFWVCGCVVGCMHAGWSLEARWSGS